MSLFYYFCGVNNLYSMRVVIQRVSSASVTIDGQVRSEIGQGLLVLLGVGPDDGAEDIDWLV